jgi:RNA polymerase sigma-70 factor (ECF subfamily)
MGVKELSAGGVMSETPYSLLERLQKHPESGEWQRLTQIYEPLLRRWLSPHQLQESDRDDLVQDVLLTLVRELPNFRHNGRPGAFRSWLRQTLAHRVHYFWRSRRHRPLTPGEGEFGAWLEQLADPASGLSRQWELEHDRHVLGHLLETARPHFAPATWEAFRRVVLDGAEPDRVAAELGTSPNAVFIAKSRVLTRLRVEARGLVGDTSPPELFS